MLPDFCNTQAGHNSSSPRNEYFWVHYTGLEMVGDTYLLNTTLCWVWIYFLMLVSINGPNLRVFWRFEPNTSSFTPCPVCPAGENVNSPTCDRQTSLMKMLWPTGPLLGRTRYIRQNTVYQYIETSCKSFDMVLHINYHCITDIWYLHIL